MFEDTFDIFLCHFLYRVAKDLGIDLEVIRIVFGCCLDSFLNVLEIMMAFVLVLFISFQYSFQTMRSLCQEECEAEVSICRNAIYVYT